MFPTNKEMNEKLAEQSFKNVALCVWCGIPLGSANHVHQSVCIRCYKLLKASLQEEEIFGSGDRKTNSSLSFI